MLLIVFLQTKEGQQCIILHSDSNPHVQDAQRKKTENFAPPTP